MIDDEALEHLREEFARRRDAGPMRGNVGTAWSEALRLLDLAAQPRRVVLGVDFGHDGAAFREDPPPFQWDPVTPPGVLDESDHRDRVARSYGSGDVMTWRRETTSGCWHQPETTGKSGDCPRHCGSTLKMLRGVGMRLRFADETETHR